MEVTTCWVAHARCWGLGIKQNKHLKEFGKLCQCERRSRLCKLVEVIDMCKNCFMRRFRLQKVMTRDREVSMKAKTWV